MKHSNAQYYALLALCGFIGAALAMVIVDVFVESPRFPELKLAIGVGGAVGGLVGHMVSSGFDSHKRDSE
jgi:hypothetical protein